MSVQEIKDGLINKGYSISTNYGLILENRDNEYVLADIRFCEERVVLPWWNEIETEKVRKLREILLQEHIPFRDKIRVY